MNKLASLVMLALVLTSLAKPARAQPLELELDPAFFTFSSDPGTLRASIRWGEIAVRGHDGYEVLVSARVIPNQQAGPEDLSSLIDLALEERDNVMELVVDSRIEGFYGIELEIRVPRETRLELEVADGGEISVDGVAGTVDIANRNGSVELAALGSAAIVDARNGSINASFDAVDPSLPMSFSTLNGSIDVTLPDEVAASARIRHTYGGVESDFPLRSLDGQLVTADLEGLGKGATRVLTAEINGGGPRYDFYTANGTVYLRRGAERVASDR